MASINKIKIISGGQTGVDRAALDIALELGFKSGGFCPKGRLAEDGIIPTRYPLNETNSIVYEIRSRKNVEISDGTLILFLTLIDNGTQKTIEICKEGNKPIYIFSLDMDINLEWILDWINTNKISTLNIAGPRESNDPGIYQKAYDFLIHLFGNLK